MFWLQQQIRSVKKPRPTFCIGLWRNRHRSVEKRNDAQRHNDAVVCRCAAVHRLIINKLSPFNARLIGRLGSEPRLVSQVGRGVRVSASFRTQRRRCAVVRHCDKAMRLLNQIAIKIDTIPNCYSVSL